jgi:hypothetical protein
MVDIVIRPLGEREFNVELSDAGRRTSHRVTVPEPLVAELGLQDDVERLVRESFRLGARHASTGGVRTPLARAASRPVAGSENRPSTTSRRADDRFPPSPCSATPAGGTRVRARADGVCRPVVASPSVL